MAPESDPAKRWDNVRHGVTGPLRPYYTEYLAPPDLAPMTGRLCDTVHARSWCEAQALCDARRGEIEIVMGVLIAEYSACEECGELHGVDYDGDAPAFTHAPLCIRNFTVGRPAVPEGI